MEARLYPSGTLVNCTSIEHKFVCTLNIQHSSQGDRNLRARQDDNILNTNWKIKCRCRSMFNTSQLSEGPQCQRLNEGYI